MPEAEARTDNVVSLHDQDGATAPYFAWLRRRYPGGEIGHNPPAGEFLASPSMRNAWTSFVPEGHAPLDLRIDLYLRRGWRDEPGTLCLGNCNPAGESAPRTWTAPTLSMLAAALGEIERLALARGVDRMAVQNPDPDVRMACMDLGYRVSATEPLDIVKPLA